MSVNELFTKVCLSLNLASPLLLRSKFLKRWVAVAFMCDTPRVCPEADVMVLTQQGAEPHLCSTEWEHEVAFGASRCFHSAAFIETRPEWKSLKRRSDT
ncbi:hypothetical protein XENOCAPTIV_011725 [Xenoophorus captivus]|uniref:Uncharacterized protein n=1 Tax=Xenoophorus captivus TaxID=1517983 RepID=A0ABV0RZ05_9TELE